MRLIAALFALFLISSASASIASSGLSAQGSGSVIRNVDITWETGADGQYLGGASGHVLLTGPGDFQYQTKDTIDATKNNRYNQTGYVQADRGVVFSDTVSMVSTQPNQEASVEYSGIMQSAEISTAKYVSDANLSMGQQAAWDGAGLYSGETGYSVDLVNEDDDTITTYRTASRDHFFISTNLSGGAIVRPEFNFIDFSDAFIFNTTSANETAVNNTTVEEA